MGFDFYQVLQLYAKLERFSEEEIHVILQMSPPPKAALRPTSKDIRMAMPRWTPTKYHTGPIDEVVKQNPNHYGGERAGGSMLTTAT